MIKIELHCHEVSLSPCATSRYKDAIDESKSSGYGAVVITNHYSKYVYSIWKGQTHEEKMQFFLSNYYQVKEYGKNQGLKVFIGVEVRDRTGTEYMLYGFKPEFLLECPPLFELDQKELFDLANRYGLFMYQTHPFRKGVTAGDPKYLHGAESFNGHYHHDNNNKEANAFCEKNNLIKMSGTDYHHEGQPFTGGAYIPENIEDELALKEYIMSGKMQLITNEDGYVKGRMEYLRSIK